MEIVSQKKLICLLMLLLCQHQQMSQGEHLDLRLKLIFLHLHLQVLRFLQLLVFFASHPASSAVSPAVDFFAAPEQVEPEIKPLESKTRSTQTVYPFAAVPMNNFDNSDFFGSFSSHPGSESTEPTQNFMDSGNQNNQNHKTPAASTHSSKKDGFQVKSGVWADSLSRGLIDLNITGHK